MTPNLPLNTWQWKVLCIHERLASEAQILVHFAQQPLFSLFFRDTRLLKSEMHQMTPNRSWTLISQKSKVPLSTKYLPLRPKVWSVSLYGQRFPRYKVAEYRKCTEWPQTELQHLTVKSTLYTLNTYPRGPNFAPFRSTTSGFQDITLFYNSALTTMLNTHKKNQKKKWPKSKKNEISQFFIQVW